jgi:SAM-dependent methyltransferase
MGKVDFDDYSNEYNDILENRLKTFSHNVEFFAENKILILKKMLNYSPKMILEYGCGIGRNLSFLSKHFPGSEIFGCDISQESLKIAEKNKFAKLYYLGSDEINDKFDLIFISCVFHHIEPQKREEVVRYIYSLLVNKGSIFVFEHNPYNPLTRYIVNTCPFDSDAILLSMNECNKLFNSNGFITLAQQYYLFFPPKLAKLFCIEEYLGWLPLGGQYFIQFSK